MRAIAMVVDALLMVLLGCSHVNQVPDELPGDSRCVPTNYVRTIRNGRAVWARHPDLEPGPIECAQDLGPGR